MTEPSDSPTADPTAGLRTGPTADPTADPGTSAERPPLRRSRRQHVLAGVCGGLGRHFDIDPVVFRIVLGVLAFTGGVGLIFYGFAWLLLPMEGEEENEARKLLTGRIEGSTLAAVLAALAGCALFLVMIDNGVMAAFSVLVVFGLGAAAYWSQRRRAEPPETRVEAALGAHVRAEAPPETQAPPVPGVSSWWRDPLVKDGTTGPVGAPYLWGPAEDTAGADGAAGPAGTVGVPGPVHGTWPAEDTKKPAPAARPRGIGGRVFLLALVAAALGTGLSWRGNPLGTALQTGLACALAVFGAGIAVSAFRGRTGFGSVLLAVVTAGLLAGAAVVPRDIGTDWVRTEWRPAGLSEVQPRYEASTGEATLDLSRVDVPKGRTLPVDAEIDAGRLKVVLPPGVTAETRIDLGVGDIQLPGDKPDDIWVRTDNDKRVTLRPAPGAAPGGTLELRLKAGVGQVEVTRAS
ncbi:PspC domain-containing protein [Streptomyces sp. NPDC093225]|uniref:PspC domain-containing protein n=1 Tax=Streptomyces sp. NPDC093225 TaxID=3366034 RepID=UPI00380F0EFC